MRNQMKLLTIYLFSVLFTPCTLMHGQKSLAKALDRLEIEQRPGSNYRDEQGKPVGCNWNLECERFSVIFYNVAFNSDKTEVRIQGRTYNPGCEMVDKAKYGDTCGMFAVTIFISTPTENILKWNKDSTFECTNPTEEGYKKFPFRTGDFDVTFKIDKFKRLYFVGYNHVLKEYRIGELVNQLIPDIPAHNTGLPKAASRLVQIFP